MPPPAPRNRTILVVDDDEGLLILMAEALRSDAFEVVTANSAKTARQALGEGAPDLMILDLKLQDAEGSALVASLQGEGTLVPFIIVTGQGDEKVAVQVMKQGALDYVMKDTGLLDWLPAVVKRALSTIDQGAALKAAQAEHVRLEREILDLTERERHTIGADLHDNLGQRLTALELMCATLKEDARAQPALAKRLDAMGGMLREAIAQTRALARGLVPVGSHPDDLQNGLTELAEQTTNAGRVICHFECAEPVTLPDAFIAGHLYRIAQEAVNNAQKHARASKIIIRLFKTFDELVLEVSDNGAGLPKAAPKRGIGLGVMRHRSSAIGAELTIDSKRGGGVAVRCVLPLTK
ncbi:MAG: response regulator [Opitutus sp.]